MLVGQQEDTIPVINTAYLEMDGRIRSHYMVGTLHCERNFSKEKNALFSFFYSVGFPSAGLFSVSRHPNYLAEISLWFVFYAFSITAGGG